MNRLDLAKLEKRLDAFGLIIRGGFNADDTNSLPALASGEHARSLLLVGHGGSSLWPAFSSSDEFSDGDEHALDRWSQRIANTMEEEFALEAAFPFTGPPYHPFLSWARLAEGASVALPSRLGLSIHQQFGLWHAYRFALLSPTIIPTLTAERASENEALSPLCVKCEGAPCLQACPASAFNEQGYDVQACVDYLKVTIDAPCHTRGCLARIACPVGRDYQYQPNHAAFHMKAFIKARMIDESN